MGKIIVGGILLTLEEWQDLDKEVRDILLASYPQEAEAQVFDLSGLPMFHDIPVPRTIEESA